MTDQTDQTDQAEQAVQPEAVDQPKKKTGRKPVDPMPRLANLTSEVQNLTSALSVEGLPEDAKEELTEKLKRAKRSIRRINRKLAKRNAQPGVVEEASVEDEASVE